ncbi:hypothetical protein FB381_4671 [Nocardioides albertanoniae]|uniref:Uncharacterized protein n=1 Tax=Nocardioides albertanoniae TaxID=1175486 RepID=A0A543ADR6_9ACTN|nr:hypothetical protein [Nocardioides albertanoniae]TQL70729.1 hypothetical protein FB381_4671 [Nocardioides albertanoniae]
MSKMWHDAFEWAERLGPGEQVDVGDVEQQVIDRAPFVLHRRERLQGLWSVCLPRSVGNQILVLLSGLAPIAGALAFAGNVQFRNIQSPGVAVGIAGPIVLLCFVLGFLCQIIGFGGWLRVGRRSRESDLILSGLLLIGSSLTLVFAAVHEAVQVSDFHLWPAWASLVASTVATAAFSLGNSSQVLPAADVSRLTELESQFLVDQRNAALKEAAKRGAVKLKNVNKAINKPLGALVAPRKG